MVLNKAYLFAVDGMVKCQGKLYFHFQQFDWDLEYPENNPQQCEHQRRVEKSIRAHGVETSSAQKLSGNYILGIAPFINNYYHFITDLLACLPQAPSWPILVPETMPQSYTDFLGQCGFSVEHLREQIYYVEHLWIPPVNEWDISSIQQMNRFVEKIIPQQNLRLDKKVYISRQMAKKRHLINEAEFWPYLEKYGFERIFLEDYTISEQIELFRHTSHVIAPHGAGLVNGAFASETMRILEIRPALNSGQFCYEKLFAARWPHYQFYVPPAIGKFSMSVQALTMVLEEWFGR